MSVKKQVDEETGGIAGIRAVPLYSVTEWIFQAEADGGIACVGKRRL